VSTYADILDKLKDLLEGSDGVTRTVTVGKFQVVGSDFEWEQAQCSQDPRPAYIEEGEETEGVGLPSDVSGDYLWRERNVLVHIGYAYDPDDDDTDRAEVIADDELEAVRCLSWPLNWALVTDWCGCQVLASRVPVRDPDGVIAIMYLRLSLGLTYRENLS
jgi:hypothetical protein